MNNKLIHLLKRMSDLNLLSPPYINLFILILKSTKLNAESIYSCMTKIFIFNKCFNKIREMTISKLPPSFTDFCKKVSLKACTVIVKYGLIVIPVIGHISTPCVSHILSLTCMEYLSCKCCGKMFDEKSGNVYFLTFVSKLIILNPALIKISLISSCVYKSCDICFKSYLYNSINGLINKKISEVTSPGPHPTSKTISLDFQTIFLIYVLEISLASFHLLNHKNLFISYVTVNLILNQPTYISIICNFLKPIHIYILLLCYRNKNINIFENVIIFKWQPFNYICLFNIKINDIYNNISINNIKLNNKML
ncbi:hypothetical protein AGLY_007046 [Aphis glycines]|uniref:Uncharacterized protein n=1 Tax=Aphis glycines TaxID=307491 RepID=A0A6G0TPK8_APHGL|nr:hypothetical protein AGLY_007046 [Aphis glycines]